eukprot:TRINITY_DN10206_c0_g1_i2.p1 TRINITY_DN10206_c0_g1~~TRINITY_DN10206_c0_g1_i2.p1  ORF type:complete len:328 (+),score=43.46 TRINITY_DN10206_c0_g1_i2:115-1098(+)
MSLSNLPPLVLLKQTSLSSDNVTRNGNTKIVHVVVKNSPFTLTFGTHPDDTSHAELDLHKYTLDIKLLYDQDPTKEVDFVKEKPLQYKTSVNQNNTKLTLEVRIKVLTSHMEDSLFRVGVQINDQHKNPVTVIYSEAIRVISKSDQVKKKAPSGKKKKNPNDLLAEALEMIEGKQREQQELLEKLCQSNEAFLTLDQRSQILNQMLQNPLITPAPPVEVPRQFNIALSNFLSILSKMPKWERQSAITQITQLPEGAIFGEILQQTIEAGLRPSPSYGVTTSSLSGVLPPLEGEEHDPSTVCSCEGCPYKRELSRIETFYQDILAFKP